MTKVLKESVLNILQTIIMAITKASTQDCRQYYHLGLPDLSDDNEEDFQVEEKGKLELQEDEQDQTNLPQELELQKDQQDHPNLAQELSQAQTHSENKIHKEVIINQLCDDNNIGKGEENQEICDVVIRSQPVSQSPAGQSVQNGWGGNRARKMLLHRVAGAEFDQVTCGRQACCVIS